MALKYPGDCITSADKIEYCYRARELLRLLHNTIGKWRREGLNQIEYNTIPQKIKDTLPDFAISPKLSEDSWDRFVSEEFFNRDHAISKAATLSFNELKKSTRWEIKVEDI